jgi:hypothetical protein
LQTEGRNKKNKERKRCEGERSSGVKRGEEERREAVTCVSE